MNMHLREGRSFVREFVEVPGDFRRTVEDAIEGLIAVLDQLDADADLEDDGSDEPTLGWPNQVGIRQLAGGPELDGELEEECEDEGAQCDDEGADDDPGEDNGDAEIDLTDENLAAPETSGGLVRVASNDNAEMTLRESLDPRLALRPEAGSWQATGRYAFQIPRFPQDPPDRPRLYVDDELWRLRAQVARLRKRRKANTSAKHRTC